SAAPSAQRGHVDVTFGNLEQARRDRRAVDRRHFHVRGAVVRPHLERKRRTIAERLRPRGLTTTAAAATHSASDIGEYETTEARRDARLDRLPVLVSDLIGVAR